MTDASARARRQSERLLRYYPKEWRLRYGDEFAELLVADIAERPRSRARTMDVAVGGVMARLAGIGLAGTTVDPADRARRTVATLGCALVVFLSFAVSMWSQLDMAQRRIHPATIVTHRAIVLMTVAVAVGVTALVVATVPMLWTAALTAVRRRDIRLPVGMFLSGSAVLLAGAILLRHGWLGAGAPPVSYPVAGPGGPGGVLWASTVAVSAYWLHPSTLLRFPVTEIAWMVVDPLAVVWATIGALRAVHRIDIPPRLLRFVGATARVAVVGLALFLAGTVMWLADGNPGPGHAFQPGSVDLVGLAVMSLALAVAAPAAVRTSLRSP